MSNWISCSPNEPRRHSWCHVTVERLVRRGHVVSKTWTYSKPCEVANLHRSSMSPFSSQTVWRAASGQTGDIIQAAFHLVASAIQVLYHCGDTPNVMKPPLMSSITPALCQRGKMSAAKAKNKHILLGSPLFYLPKQKHPSVWATPFPCQRGATNVEQMSSGITWSESVSFVLSLVGPTPQAVSQKA